MRFLFNNSHGSKLQKCIIFLTHGSVLWTSFRYTFWDYYKPGERTLDRTKYTHGSLTILILRSKTVSPLFKIIGFIYPKMCCSFFCQIIIESIIQHLPVFQCTEVKQTMTFRLNKLCCCTIYFHSSHSSRFTFFTNVSHKNSLFLTDL